MRRLRRFSEIGIGLLFGVGLLGLFVWWMSFAVEGFSKRVTTLFNGRRFDLCDGFFVLVILAFVAAFLTKPKDKGKDAA